MITRKFSISDAILMAHIGKILEGLPRDQPVFEEEIAIIDQAFVDGLSADYSSALAEGGDQVVRGKVGEKTQSMLEAMDEAKRLVKRLRFWVDLVYADNAARRRSFNLRQFWKVATSQPKLIQFMNNLSTQVQEHRADLLEAGAKQEFFEAISANAAALATADAVQESSKGGRSNATQNRVIALNALYDRARLLDNAADILFEEDPLKASFYSMPVQRPKAEDLEEEAYG